MHTFVICAINAKLERVEAELDRQIITDSGKSL